MEYDYIIVRCLHCGTKNRIPRERLGDKPSCGKCRAPLDEMIIRCLYCGTKNRMPEERPHDKPRCGRCGAPLVLGGEMGRPIEVTDASFFREVLKSTGAVVVDCWAPWCVPCRSVDPVIEDLAVRYAGGAKFAKLNVDENPVTTLQYSIRNIPTLLFFQAGELRDRLVGAISPEEIEKRLLAIIKTN